MNVSFKQNFEAQIQEARIYYTQNNLARSFEICRFILDIEPDHYEALLLAALNGIKAGNFEKAEDVLNGLIKRNPKDTRPIIAKAFGYEGQAEIEKANKQFARVLKVDPKHADANFHLVLTYERMNKLKEAEKAVKRGLRLLGDTPGLLYMAAIIFRRQKKYQEAIEHLIKIPDDIEAEYVSNKHFELMQSYDRTKEYDLAFESLEIAQDKRKEYLKRQQYTQQKESYQSLVEGYLNFFKNSKDQEPNHFKPKTPKNLCFFVGFPRSGTTLAQQMLQAHPDVETLEEKGTMTFLATNFIKDHGSDFSKLNSLSLEDIEKFRKQYDSFVKELLPGKNYKLLIDKMPLGTTHLPLIMTLFPEAKILIALRHPCDCILSGMMQNFDPNPAMLNLTTLQDGATLYSNVFTILEKSIDYFGFQPHFFRYEDIIVDTEKEQKDICEFLGLEWQQDMMEYQKIAKEQNLIHTASFRQVVEPLHQKAKYRWLNYKKYYEKVLPILRPHLKKFSYPEK